MNNIDNITKELYANYTPAFDNLYNISISGYGSSDDELKDYIQYHAIEVSLPEESITLARNNVTKNYTIEGNDPFKWITEVTIKWQEADDWRVRRYHEDWLNCFYNKTTGKFISAESDDQISARYKKITITLPCSRTSKSSTINQPHVLVLEHVLPKNTGKISLGWKPNASIVQHTMSYYVGRWYWQEDKDKENLSQMANNYYSNLNRGHGRDSGD